MINHPLSKIIDGFDLLSYYAGINMTFAEVISVGCKKLALSSPYRHEIAEKILPATEYASEKYNVKLMVKPKLLVTTLFPHDIAKSKTVILIAHDQSIIDDYMILKKLKEKSDAVGNPDEVELEIAIRFGKLLC
jgi:hypothetical protein